ICYGIEVQPENDPYLQNAQRVLIAVDEAGTPGSFLIDIMPWFKSLKYLSAWMPGCNFQWKAALWQKYSQEILDLPFQEAK
ncbi:hypothetical protein M422DRAFT_144395, partial [Sphaerobolus stellatus SS14]